MKIVRSILIAALASGNFAAAQAVFTDPVGYSTTTLSPGFNLVGLTLHKLSIHQGTFDSFTATSLTDSGETFTVNADSNYILEMKDTSGVSGVVIELPGTAFSGDTISNLEGITASYLGGYTIRESATFDSIFGSGSACVLKKGTSTTADSVYLPNGDGGFNIYYHSADVTSPISIPGTWRLLGEGSTDRSSDPISYLDGFYVNIRGEAVDLTVDGEVKLQDTSLPVASGFSYFSAIYPAGTTLDSSGLAGSVLKGTSTTADLLYFQNGVGGFDIYFHSNDVTVPIPISGTWRLVGGGSTDRGSTPMPSGFIIQRRGSGMNMPFTPPSSYAGQ